MSTLRTWRLAVLLAGGMSAAAFADHRDAGSRRPYTLTLDALVGPSRTDVVLHVSAPGGEALPREAGHVLLWTTSGRRVTWSRHFEDVALIDGLGTIPNLPISDHERVSALVEVRVAGTHHVQILSAETVAMSRPDLRIAQVQAPSEVQVGQIANIGVVIQEIRGYRGATFNVRLLEGSTLLDTVTGATIDPMGTVTALFALRIDTAGTHELTAVISDASPAEYDTTNNSATFTIRALDLAPVAYSLAYQRIEGEFSDNFLVSTTTSTIDATSTETRVSEQESRYLEIGRHETFDYKESLDRFVSGVIQFSATIRVDGADRRPLVVMAWSPFFSGSGEGWAQNTYQAYDPDTNSHLYLDSMWTAEKGASTVLQLSRTAGDYAFTSTQYDRFWSTVTTIDPISGEPVVIVSSGETVTDNSGSVVEGIFLDAFQTIQMRSALVLGDASVGGWTQEHAVLMSDVDRTWDETRTKGNQTTRSWGYERRTYWDAVGNGVTAP